MPATRPKWGQVEKHVLSLGYEIRNRGGDRIIVAPKDGNNAGRTRNTLRIGHKSCRNAGTELYPCYASKLRHVFGLDLDEICKL